MHVSLESDFSHFKNETKIIIESIPKRLMNETGMNIFEKLLLWTTLIRDDLILRFTGYIYWFAATYIENKIKRTKILNRTTQLYVVFVLFYFGFFCFFLDSILVNKDVLKDLYTTIHLLGKFFSWNSTSLLGKCPIRISHLPICQRHLPSKDGYSNAYTCMWFFSLHSQ